jgi:hypothetical protein
MEEHVDLPESMTVMFFYASRGTSKGVLSVKREL